MTKEERQHLAVLIAELEKIQQEAPQATIFIQGRTDGSMAYRLLGVIQQMKQLTETDTEKQAS